MSVTFVSSTSPAAALRRLWSLDYLYGKCALRPLLAPPEPLPY
jgi:hypothetical protein